MSMWLMYLVLKLDDILTGLYVTYGISLAIAIIGTFILIIVTCYHHMYDYIEEDCWFLAKGAATVKKYLIKIWIVAIISGVLSLLLPTTKQAAAIYFVPKIINNKQIQKMPNKLVTLANAWMDEELKTVKEKK